VDRRASDRGADGDGSVKFNDSDGEEPLEEEYQPMDPP